MKRMEDKVHPDEKVGTKYRHKSGGMYTLQYNDGTKCPFFDDKDGYNVCEWWEDLYKVEMKVLIGGEIL